MTDFAPESRTTAIAGAVALAGTRTRSTQLAVPPAIGKEEEMPATYPWSIHPGPPARFTPYRFGLVFQSHPMTPGTLAQQSALRSGIEALGYGTPRHRMLWFFAREYKKRQDYNYGGLEGSLHHVNVSIEGSGGFAFANAVVLPSWASGSDLWLTFCHEWGHLFDRYTMNPDMRLALMDTIATDNPWANDGNWQGGPAPEDFWQRPQEVFAWSFQRLCDPELAELPGGYTRQVLAEVLPDWDQAWLDSGQEIND